MKIPKKITITAFVIMGIFVSLIANAYTITSQTNSSVESDLETTSGVLLKQSLGNGLSGDLESIDIYVHNNTGHGTGSVQVHIRCYDDNTYTTSLLCPGAISFVVSSTETQWSPGETSIKNEIFTSSSSLDNSLYYILEFVVDSTPGFGEFGFRGSNVSSSYLNGACIDNVATCGSVQDIYFVLYASGSNIEFDYPINSSSINDFTNWRFDKTVDSGDAYKIKIYYGTSTSYGITQETGWNLANEDDASGIVSIPKSQLLTSSTYYAEADLFVNFSSASSSNTGQISFSIGTGTQEFSGYPYGQGLTQAEQESLCSTTSTGWFDFGAGICQAFTFLFMPNQNTLDQFASLKDEMALKAPFAIFTGVADAWNNVEINATNTPSVSIDFASTGVASGTPFASVLPTWNAFSSTTIKTYLSDTQIDLFKALITLALWVLYAQSSYYKLLGIFN